MPNLHLSIAVISNEDDFYSESLPHPHEFGPGVEYLDDVDPFTPGFALSVPEEAEVSALERIALWAKNCEHTVDVVNL